MTGTARTGPARHVLLARVLGGSGVLHLVVPQVYDAIVPRWLPLPARFWTLSSGVAELVVATLLSRPETRRAGGWAAAALLVCVFPANLGMAARLRGRGWPFALALARLPLQAPLVAWAVRTGRGEVAGPQG